MEQGPISYERLRKERQALDTVRKKEEQEFAEKTANKLGFPYADLTLTPIEREAIVIVPERESREAELAVILNIKNGVRVVVKNPKAPKTLEIIDQLRAKYKNVDVLVTDESSLERAWSFYPKVDNERREYAGKVTISAEIVEKFRGTIKTAEDFTKSVSAIAGEQITDIVEKILAGALALRSSDVHLEMHEDGQALLRIRIDGILEDVAVLPAHVYTLLLTRIKLLAGVKINIRKQAQDGRFSLDLGGATIEIRAAVLPGEFGENVALRVLDPSFLLSLEKLGLREDLQKIAESALRQPTGLILATGPTGSGKTTTLYAFLRELASPEVKIITIEDPIEYHLEGVTQTQVREKEGYNFANGLRAILRQDPDILLVGEVRDFDTAQSAMHAALTGHLVFSTLHTNDATSAISRLVDMGVNPSIASSALSTVIAERLVRVLCQNCKTTLKATAGDREYMKKIISENSSALQAPEIPKDTYGPGKCAACGFKGYRGREGVFEIWRLTPALASLVAEATPEEALRQEVRKSGVTSLGYDALLKVFAGRTSLEEMKRVLGA